MYLAPPENVVVLSIDEKTGIRWHTHDPGVVLSHLAVAIADGADCLSDMAVLREQTELFGPVASRPTAWRAVSAVASVELAAIPRAVAAARARVWAAAGLNLSAVTLDFDVTSQVVIAGSSRVHR